MTRAFCALAENPLYPCRARDRHQPSCPGKDCSPGCKPADGEPMHEGHCPGCLPRLATHGSKLCRHHHDRAQENLRELVTLDQALYLALSPTGSCGDEPVAGTKTVGIDLNETAMDARTVIRERLNAFVSFTVTERHVTAPTRTDLPNLIAWLDRHHDWWCNHTTDTAVIWFVTLQLRVTNARTAAYPSGTRRLPTGLPCEEHTTNDAGQRVPCPGKLTTTVGGNTYTDLVCTADRDHRITPAEWQKSAFKTRLKQPLNPDAVRALHGRITA